eukprot:CAMPEP_0116890010 /NCGR_PEP_ID=MMETSP0467-20121206/558_1 /TAXON_ID=283647 /ORGANISM="Mesodinium pulex, Strain SPMC105" /LENGTH=61 /DNA_ID=CAMNT_0004557361 /DNA_START=1640 /DNA_END=1825 /DNA_ORIENTATION=+
MKINKKEIRLNFKNNLYQISAETEMSKNLVNETLKSVQEQEQVQVQGNQDRKDEDRNKIVI